jgi:beta-glucosidase-like glycosyl hydrolase
MPEYRAYILSDDDHIQSYETMACVDDESAITAAKRLVNGCDVELWQGARKVIILAHKGGQMKPT